MAIVKTVYALAGAAIVAAGAQAQPAGGPVKIGVMADMSSAYSDIGGKGLVEAARMAVQDFGGSVLGRPVEVLAGDHQNRPDVGTALARRWYDQERVDAIMDIPNSGIALAVQQVARERKRLVI